MEIDIFPLNFKLLMDEAIEEDRRAHATEAEVLFCNSAIASVLGLVGVEFKRECSAPQRLYAAGT